jgi:glycosyltransferase involved in cell wall biosynthesis
MVTVSIMIPTISRPSLLDLVGDLLGQLANDDEIIVIGDGPQPQARAMMEGRDWRIRYFEFGPTRCWGHPQRNVGMSLADKDYILSLDDDDRVQPDYLSSVRQAAAECPARPLIFRMYHKAGILWQDTRLEMANVSTQMFAVPNVKGRLGRWGRRYEGDLDFIKETLAFHPDKEEAAVWRTEVTVVHGIAGTLSEHPKGTLPT